MFIICSRTSFEKNCFSAWASTLNMGLINKVDMVCLSPVGYGVLLTFRALNPCLLYGLVDYSGKRTKSFEVLTSDLELEVRTATYGPEIDLSQRAKSVSHVIDILIPIYTFKPIYIHPQYTV